MTLRNMTPAFNAMEYLRDEISEELYSLQHYSPRLKKLLNDYVFYSTRLTEYERSQQHMSTKQRASFLQSIEKKQQNLIGPIREEARVAKAKKLLTRGTE